MSADDERVAKYAEAIWNASRADEGTISATGANIVARAIVALVDAEVEMVRRGARTLGKQLDDTLFHVLRASGRSDLIGEDGDGDWELVWEALDALRPRAEAAERDLAVERARAARVGHALALTDDQRAQISADALDHGQLLDLAFAAGVEAARAALADPDAQNGSGRPVTPAPSTDTSEGSQGRTAAHSTPNEANRGRRTKGSA